ncbi:hypothetical protein Cob_v010480 [Colletotrichum orbiculare MAFF 240422]|uniref:Uncharacterized protein n=1 Tax=Colletotrichum orbiculare (strain 104-T / ATCC 96160 / CBS 514.97 / LARS 414 / MAFF 240422) TaxID=1213857 RepID=A0A484FFD2_COLOR|nr:hypothetical protein Cob_v010480 [Colletotrichum orbiculare MAFF 240422]
MTISGVTVDGADQQQARSGPHSGGVTNGYTPYRTAPYRVKEVGNRRQGMLPLPTQGLDRQNGRLGTSILNRLCAAQSPGKASVS